MHRRWEITPHQRLIVAFHNTCWITSEPAWGSVSSLPWKPTPYYSACTHTEGAIAMASGVVVTRSQFTQQLTGHSVNLLSITPCLTLSPPLSPPLSSFFALFLQQISFVKSQKSYLLSAEDKVLQCSAGAALGRVVTEEKKKLCRDPERCPEMQLNRHRTHARNHHHYHH